VVWWEPVSERRALSSWLRRMLITKKRKLFFTLYSSQLRNLRDSAHIGVSNKGITIIFFWKFLQVSISVSTHSRSSQYPHIVTLVSHRKTKPINALLQLNNEIMSNLTTFRKPNCHMHLEISISGLNIGTLQVINLTQFVIRGWRSTNCCYFISYCFWYLAVEAKS